ncbi:serine beta-lactamase-like protein LACTB, mitochondrial [Asterias amurensis]|uniref:serine beta-lactamase-like protein LACTB, mitochondrial n=1 Tax=Asterias amurensis TaxID=7602 RepID=UPI003AB333C4
MFKVKGALLDLQSHQWKSKVCLTAKNWYHSHKTGSHSGRNRLRLSFLWTLGGGVAVATGLVASLLLKHKPIKDLGILGVEEAQCKKKDKIDKRKRGGTSGLEEAKWKARDLLQRAKDEVGSPGIVAAVSVDGRLLWTEGLGYADIENRLPCTSDSVHRIASISKSFTMAAVAKLWEEGKLDMDKPVQFYLPEFPEKEVDGEQVDITMRQLVSHLAGIRHYSKDYIKKLKDSKKDNRTENKSTDHEHDGKNSSKDDQMKELTDNGKEKCNKKEKDSELKEFYVTKDYSSVVDALEMFKEDPLMHKPGSKFYYTTHGWTLVSAIVDAVADQDYLTYMETIFKDLGMDHTVPDKAKPLIYNRARGYSYNKRGKLLNSPPVNLSHKWAGGGFLSDVGDLVQFGNAMVYSYQYTEKHREAGYLPGYLKPETVRAIWAAVPITKCSWERDGFYAMGWGVRDKGEQKGFCPDKHQLVSHTGAAVGASSVLLLVPRESDPLDKTQLNDGSQEGSVQEDGKPDDQNESNKLSQNDVMTLPQGVVVAIIVNLENVNLYRTAIDIANEFQKIKL